MSSQQVHGFLVVLFFLVRSTSTSDLAIASDDSEKNAFFETKIRPALHEHCLNCHNVGKKNGGLSLDSRDGWMQGGDSGPAIVPGQPDESLLLRSIQHREAGLEMPAKAPKLSDGMLEDFRKWIADGAVDPRDKPESLNESNIDWEKLFQDRSQWWCWQPNPMLNKPDSYRGIDFWLNRKMEELGVVASDSADSQQLVRRLSFQLRGLPPDYRDVQAFETTHTDEAWKKLVDRYLESPEFAEHWARHWMDTVRYSETHGSEDDAYLPFAYRYRDYLVRSFQQDVPINRLIEEHLAGDLIEPRWTENGVNEALIGLAFWRFIEFNQTPVDVKKEEIVVIDSQIDAVGKAFQGITISCARCHDHKFDPISDEDYYAMYGVLRSTRSGLRVLDRPESFSQHNTKLDALQTEFTRHWSNYWSERLTSAKPEFVEAVQWLGQNPQGDTKWQEFEKQLPAGKSLMRALARLRDGRGDASLRSMLEVLVKPSDAEFVQEWKKWKEKTANPSNVIPADAKLLWDLSDGDFKTWRVDGAGLPAQPLTGKPQWTVQGNSDTVFTTLQGEGFHSNLLSDRHAGILRSPDFVVESDLISLLCRGTAGARARLVIENFQGDSLLFETINPTLNSDQTQWVTMTIRPQWKGLRAHIELLTRDAKPYIGVTKDPSYLEKSDGRSSFGLFKVVAHSRGVQLPQWRVIPDSLLTVECDSRDSASAAILQSIRESLDRLKTGTVSKEDIRWLNGWMESGWLSLLPSDAPTLRQTIDEYKRIENQIPKPHWAPGVYEDRLPVNQAWLNRGDHKTPGKEVERGYLVALKEVIDPIPQDASGRLQLARSITNPNNPLTARVYVNRVWNWLFGEGLVRSVDNFGRMGEVPSHPELLDELAARFMAEGWSTKQLIRHIVNSKAWQRSTTATETSISKDPDNRLWSHMVVRRIDAESIRDSMLYVAGNLKRPDSGLGTLPFYQAVMEPNKQSPPGPLDGSGRRSLYLEVRRNFPYEFLLSFDFPRPASPVGKRNTTIVPTQSLTMLNDPLVLHQSQIWANKIRSADGDQVSKVQRMYQELLGRQPTAEELPAVQSLLEDVRTKEGEEKAWHVLAHGMFNLKEFIFLR